MNKNKTALADHHCSIIEKDLVEKELAECDIKSKSDEEREKCYRDVEITSSKRLKACLHS